MDGNIVLIIGDFFAQAITWQWGAVAIPVSFVASVLMNRYAHSLIWAAIAMVIHIIVEAELPALLASQPLTMEVITKAFEAKIAGGDWPVALLEFASFWFMIVIFYLTRIDMAREWPPKPAQNT